MCSVCPSQKMTIIVETGQDPINQVTPVIFTFESRVISALLTKDVLFVLVGSEPGDFFILLFWFVRLSDFCFLLCLYE